MILINILLLYPAYFDNLYFLYSVFLDRMGYQTIKKWKAIKVSILSISSIASMVFKKNQISKYLILLLNNLQSKRYISEEY